MEEQKSKPKEEEEELKAFDVLEDPEFVPEESDEEAEGED